MRERDEVIVPDYTYTASASATIHCGATENFVDIQKDGNLIAYMPEMDYTALEAMITERTKVVVVVDLGGIVVDYDRVFEIAERKSGQLLMKRLFDFIVSLILRIILPIPIPIAIIALLNKKEDMGSALYR